MPLFQTVTDFDAQADILRRRRYGVIEAVNGRLSAVHLRPWPKLVSLPEIWLLGGHYHRRTAGDRCWLYYNQPRGRENFLAVTYFVSSRDATLQTCLTALVGLDEIARLKQTDAVLAEVSNRRISDRILARHGWQRHLHNSCRRHFIERFYGVYPQQENTYVSNKQHASC